MTNSERFIAMYETRDVPDTAEIIAALRDGSARMTNVPEAIQPASAAELLRTYEVRVKHLSRFSTQHAAQLRREAEAFCSGLRGRPSDRCVAWGIESAPYFLYWVWEWASDGTFIASTKIIDDRKISDEERTDLWRPKNTA